MRKGCSGLLLISQEFLQFKQDLYQSGAGDVLPLKQALLNLQHAQWEHSQVQAESTNQKRESMPKTQAIKKPSSNLRWYLLGFALLLILFMLGVWELQTKYADIDTRSPEEAYQSRSPYIGELGGVPVTIPHYFISSPVEYDGDPSFWSGKFHTRPAQSKRTHSSKMNSLTIITHYPDMIGRKTLVLENEWWKSLDSPQSQWINIMLTSGENYHKDGLQRIAEGAIEPKPSSDGGYTRMPDQIIGGKKMEVYIALGKVPETGEPYRETKFDLFIDRDEKTRRIKTYIKCSHRNVPRPPCHHYLDLQPKMAVEASVSYPRQMLPEWQGIEAKSKELIYSFEQK